MQRERMKTSSDRKKTRLLMNLSLHQMMLFTLKANSWLRAKMLSHCLSHICPFCALSSHRS